MSLLSSVYYFHLVPVKPSVYLNISTLEKYGEEGQNVNIDVTY